MKTISYTISAELEYGSDTGTWNNGENRFEFGQESYSVEDAEDAFLDFDKAIASDTSNIKRIVLTREIVDEDNPDVDSTVLKVWTTKK